MTEEEKKEWRERVRKSSECFREILTEHLESGDQSRIDHALDWWDALVNRGNVKNINN